MMQLVFGTADDDAARAVQDFDVLRYHGCYFIRF